MAKRLYYRIGQACKQLDIQPYVLRYWETEFAALHPDKSKSGQRVYSKEDLAIIRRIKELLYDEGFTIAGAKKRLDIELESGAPAAKPSVDTPQEASEEASEDASAEAPTEPVKEPAEATAASQLDTAATEQIETLRHGVREALDQTRELLAMLEAKPATKQQQKKKKKSASKKA